MFGICLGHVWNFEYVCNMFDRGIIDPSKVTRSALENAVSAACTLLSVGCSVIVDDVDDN